MPYPWNAGDVLTAADLNSAFQRRLDLGSTTLQTVSGPVTFAKYIVVPVGAVADRPTSPSTGSLRYNTQTAELEVWTGSTWQGYSTNAQIVAPGVPTISLGTPSSSAIPVSWAAPATGSAPFSYQLQYRVSGTSAWTAWGSSTTALTATITGLSANTSYDVEVIATNSAGSTASAIVSKSTAGIVPAAPTGLAATAETSTTISVSWAASATGTAPISYSILYVIGTTGMQSLAVGAATSGTITGLQPATTYTISVTASNSAGSTTSSTITAATSAAATVAPSAPTALASSNVTANAATISWTAPSSGTTPFSYSLSYSVSGSSPTVLTGVTSPQSIAGLNPSTAYSVTVTATNSAGSATSSALSVTTAAPPAAATGTVAGSQTSGSSSYPPVITGPVSGQLTTSAALVVSGVSITSSSSTVTLSITATNGTVSATVGGAAIAGSGTSTISYSATVANVNAALSTLTYTAPSSTMTATLTIKVTDQSGNSNDVVVSLTIVAAPVQSNESPAGTSIRRPSDPAIIDASNEAYTMVATSGNQVAVNGAADPTTQNVAELYYANHAVYQQNSEGQWWYEASQAAGWTFSPNPQRVVPTITGTTYYVSTTGSNSNAGTTPATAFAGIPHAVSMCNAGDGVIVEAGAYTLANQINFGVSGTSSAPIVVAAAAGAMPTIVCPSSIAFAFRASTGISHITIDGFEIAGDMQSVTLTDAQNAANSTPVVYLPSASQVGIYFGEASGPAGQGGLTISNCLIHDFGGGGVTVAWHDNTTINNNIIYNCGWYGPQGGSGIQISTPHTNGTGGSINIVNNVLTANAQQVNTDGVGAPTGGHGVYIFDSQSTSQDSVIYPNQINITGNLCYGNGGWGIQSYYSSYVVATYNTCYQNGTVGGNLGEIGIIYSDTCQVLMNIAYASSGLMTTADNYISGTTPTSTNILWNNNCLFGGTNGFTNSSDVLSDPQFINAPGSFMLKSSTPLLGQGNGAWVPPTNDITGYPRLTQYTTIGAYELVQ